MAESNKYRKGVRVGNGKERMIEKQEIKSAFDKV